MKRMTISAAIIATTFAAGSVMAASVPNYPERGAKGKEERATYNEQRLSNTQWDKDGGWTESHKPKNIGNVKNDVDHKGIVSKLNGLDIDYANAYDHADDAYDSSGRAHTRIDGNDAQIKQLKDSKVDRTEFVKDQKRQDDHLGKLDGDVSFLKDQNDKSKARADKLQQVQDDDRKTSQERDFRNEEHGRQQAKDIKQLQNTKADAGEVNQWLETKVSHEEFEADQKRQDNGINENTVGVAKAVQDSSDAKESASDAMNYADEAMQHADHAHGYVDELRNDTQAEFGDVHGDIDELHGHLEDSDAHHQSQHDTLENRVSVSEGDIHTINNGNVVRDQRITSNTKATEKVQGSVNTLSDRTGIVEGDVDRLQEKQTVQANRLDTTDRNVATNKTLVEKAQNGVNEVNTRVDGVDTTLNSHNGRITTLEGKTTEQGEQIDRNTQNISKSQKAADNAQHTGNVAYHNTQINAQNIDALNQEMGTVDSRIANGNTRTLNAANDYTDSRMGIIDEKVNKTRKEARAGIAGVAAMANIPQVADKDLTIGVGIGNFQDATAVAAGGVYKTSQVSAVKFSVASDGHEQTYGLGFSTGF